MSSKVNMRQSGYAMTTLLQNWGKLAMLQQQMLKEKVQKSLKWVFKNLFWNHFWE